MRHVNDLFDLTGEVAIITGGTAGIGLQMACALGEAGADLVLATRELDRCAEVAKDL